MVETIFQPISSRKLLSIFNVVRHDTCRPWIALLTLLHHQFTLMFHIKHLFKSQAHLTNRTKPNHNLLHASYAVQFDLMF